MGKIQNLTKEQELILDEVERNNFLRSNFYFTGGTALSAVYLQHRYSDDLDLFSRSKLDNQVIATFMEEWGKRHSFTFESRFVEVVYIFDLNFTDKVKLKVDFAYYPYKHLAEPTVIGNLLVDSLLDIAVNKLHTIQQRSEVKDFVDLYFLLQKFFLWDLFEGVKIKFRTKPDPMLLAADLLVVEEFNYLPRMIKPLELEALKAFFREEVKKLGRKFVE